MELRKHLDYRNILIGLYFLALIIYLWVGFLPAGAYNYEITAELNIPSIELVSDVTSLSLENHELKTPDYIVGSFSRAKNKTLLIGHASTVFKKLDEVQIGDEIVYDDTIYYIYSKEILEKSEVKMGKLLAKADKETLVVMTCAGEQVGETDATHRLILYASVK